MLGSFPGPCPCLAFHLRILRATKNGANLGTRLINVMLVQQVCSHTKTGTFWKLFYQLQHILTCELSQNWQKQHTRSICQIWNQEPKLAETAHLAGEQQILLSTASVISFPGHSHRQYTASDQMLVVGMAWE